MALLGPLQGSRSVFLPLHTSGSTVQLTGLEVKPCCAAGLITSSEVERRIQKTSTPVGERSRLASLLLVSAGRQAVVQAMAALLQLAILSHCQHAAKC